MLRIRGVGDGALSTLMQRLRARARRLTDNLAVLALALRHPDTPWYARACGALTMLYALSPIDLIPDFIPVLGLLDDLILLPAGIALTVRMIPAEVWEACAARVAAEALGRPPRDARGAILVVLSWVLVLAVAVWLVHGRWP